MFCKIIITYNVLFFANINFRLLFSSGINSEPFLSDDANVFDFNLNFKDLIMKNTAEISIKTITGTFLIFCLTTIPQSFAGDTRGYVSPKSEIKGMVFYYLNTYSNEKYKKGDKIGDDFNLKSNVEVFRPIYYFKPGDHTITFQSLIPFGNISLDGEDAGNKSFSTSGLADISLLAGLWLVEKPESKTWFGVSEWIKMPTGEYDNKRALNMGYNQWAFKSEAGFVQGFGNFYIELTPSIEFYTDNSDYGATSAILERDPVFVMESHLSYDMTKSALISLDHYYKKGGESKVSGAPLNDESDNQSLQLTFLFKTADNQRLLLQYLEDVKIENGPKASKFGMRLTYLM